MEWRVRTVAVLVAIALPGLAVAQDAVVSSTAEAHACETAYAALPQGTVLDLFDPKASAGRRAAALAAYERLSAMSECPEFGYTLGQLYRHGEYLPGNVVAQDVPRARQLIRPMAEDGHLAAIADMAEMEMRHANVREAMTWTQVYLHYVDRIVSGEIADPRERYFMRSGYNAHLLARATHLWRHLLRPRLPDKQIRSDLGEFLAMYGSRIGRGLAARGSGAAPLRVSAQEGGPTRVTDRADDCYVTPIKGAGSGSASWIVEVLPSGETRRIVLESFVPKVEVADELANCLASYRFAPFPGTDPTTIRVSMVMGSPEQRPIMPRRR